MDNFSFCNDGISVNVLFSFVEQKAWLTKDDIALLFSRNRTVISRHIKKLYEDKVFLKESTYAKFARVQLEGNREVSRTVDYFDLSIVYAIGDKINNTVLRPFKLWCDEIFANNLAQEKSNLIRFTNDNISIDVNVSPDEGTVWLNQSQIALLFDTTQPNISIHIKNIIEEKELSLDSVHKEHLYTASDGKNYLMSFYNLDMILAIGYRIKTSRAVIFRKWATETLKQYLMKGYVLNEDRLIVSKENLLKLQEEIQNVKKEINKIKENTFIKPIKAKIFYNGQYFDAVEFVCSLFVTSEKSIHIIDPYFDIKGLKLLSKAKRNVKKHVFISKKSTLNDNDVSNYRKQYGSINVYRFDKCHDRYLLIDDNECYSIGTSFNYMGKRVFSILKIEDEYVVSAIKNKIKEKKTNKIFI